nr:unnamed protein product [Callosobruchus analis]
MYHEIAPNRTGSCVLLSSMYLSHDHHHQSHLQIHSHLKKKSKSTETIAAQYKFSTDNPPNPNYNPQHHFGHAQTSETQLCDSDESSEEEYFTHHLTTEQMPMKYKNLKKRVKKMVANTRTLTTGTGGEPGQVEILDPVMEPILEIITRYNKA